MLDSIDNILGAFAAGNGFNRILSIPTGQASAATTSCGSTNIGRSSTQFTIPSVGGGLSGIYLTDVSLVPSNTSAGLTLMALEYLLGTLTVSGNVFSSAGSVSMPTKTVRGSAIQTASLIPVVAIINSLTATTPVLTITYTDQNGNTGQTCTMTLPTNPAFEGCFLMTPHLANGDTGVQAVTNISISTGSAGVLKVFGLLPIHAAYMSGASPINRVGNSPPLRLPFPPLLCEPGEVLAFYNFDSASSVGHHVAAKLSGIAA